MEEIMSSSKWIIALIIAIVIIAVYAYVEPQFRSPDDPKTPISDQNPRFNLHPEKDKTDTYAIQLDSSEKDQNDELKELEQGPNSRPQRPVYPPKR